MSTVKAFSTYGHEILFTGKQFDKAGILTAWPSSAVRLFDGDLNCSDTTDTPFDFPVYLHYGK